MKTKYIIALLFISTIVITASAYMLNFYAQIQATVTVEGLIEIDGFTAEELILEENFTISPAQTIEFEHNITTTESMFVYFTWMNETGIDTRVIFNGMPISSIYLVKDVPITFYTNYTISPMCSSGTYNMALNITAVL